MIVPRSPGVIPAATVVLATACLVAAATASAFAQEDGPPSDSLGADTPFFEEGFAAPGPFGQAVEERGSLGNDEGVFRITLAQDDTSLWSWANFTEKDVVWWAEGTVSLGAGAGSAGLMCGSDLDTDDFLVGAVNGANEWGILHIHDSESAIVAGGPLPDSIDLSSGGTTRLAVECAVTGGEADHVRVWADGELMGSHAAAPRIGPYDLIGLFADAPRAPWSATFDDVAVSYGTAYRAPAESAPGASVPVSGSPGATPAATPAATPIPSPSGSS